MVVHWNWRNNSKAVTVQLVGVK